MEKAKNVFVVPADYDWDDVGTWTALARTQPLDENQNLARGKTLLLDTKGTIVFNQEDKESSRNPIVVTLGVEDLVVVTTEHATLVCPKDRVQEIKKIHAALEEMDETQYL